MEWGRFSTDQLEQRLLAIQREKSALDAETIVVLEELDRRQVATGDGCRSLSEWAAMFLDVSLDTAKDLVRTMRRTTDRPDLRDALATGSTTFDRVSAVSRIQKNMGLIEHLDIASVRREAANRARIEADSVEKTADDRFLVLQPSLDESWWKLWGGLDGVSGAVVDQVLQTKADSLPDLPDGSKGDAGWRKATALVELATSDEAPPAQVTFFVDTEEAAETSGETGVVLEAGPKVGKQALEAILCDAVTEVTAVGDDGQPMKYGRSARTAPPALRRAVIHRDGNRCAADGCDSRYRLEAHHIVPWAQGGTTDPENLVTLCWFHHHIVVHERGFHIHRHPQHGRIRFHKPDPQKPNRPTKGEANSLARRYSTKNRINPISSKAPLGL